MKCFYCDFEQEIFASVYDNQVHCSNIKHENVIVVTHYYNYCNTPKHVDQIDLTIMDGMIKVCHLTILNNIKTIQCWMSDSAGTNFDYLSYEQFVTLPLDKIIKIFKLKAFL